MTHDQELELGPSRELAREARARETAVAERVLADAELLRLVAAGAMNWRGFFAPGARLRAINLVLRYENMPWHEKVHDNLDLTTFTDADLSLCKIVSYQQPWFGIDDADWSRIKLRGAFLQSLHFNHTALVQADFSYATIRFVDFNHGPLERAAFEKTLVHRVVIQGDERHGRVDLRRARFDQASLSESRFAHADLSQASFEGCQAAGTGFIGCELAGAQFVGCDLRGADFRGSSIGDASFVHCQLDGALRD